MNSRLNKSLIRTTIIASLFGVALSGCETTGAVVGASQKGLGAFSCDEIYNTFSAYDKDKITIDSMKQLSSSIGIPYTGGSAGEYFGMVKTTANVALGAQGCNPL